MLGLSKFDIIMLTKRVIRCRREDFTWSIQKQILYLKIFGVAMNGLRIFLMWLCFGGKEVIKPEALHEMDTDVSGVI